MSEFEIVCGQCASSLADFVNPQRGRWNPEKRPAEHPFDCDFRESLGLSGGDDKHTGKDIERLAKQASRWWHPDSNNGVDHGFKDFKEMQKIFMSGEARKRYSAHVDKEKKLAAQDRMKVAWRTCNRRFLNEETIPSRLEGQAPSTEPSTKAVDMLHVFLDSSSSMKGEWNGTCFVNNMLTDLGAGVASPLRIDRAKAVFAGLYPRLEKTATNIHLVGGRRLAPTSRKLVSHHEDLSRKQGEEEKILERWTAAVSGTFAPASGTFLWQYVYEQVKEFKGAKHEVIIITDGEDNCSSGPFCGLRGFNELMTQMGGGAIIISLNLIGNSLSSEDTLCYRDLCMATGGVFFHDDLSSEAELLALQDFIVPLLLPDLHREELGRRQQQCYEMMLADGNAESFQWYLPLKNEASTPPKGKDETWSSYSVMELTPGAVVKVQGLVGASHLNGVTGTCIKFLQESKRWEVQLPGKVISALRKNLEVLQ